MKKEPINIFTKKIIIIVFISFAFSSLIIFRLFWLQVKHQNKFLKRSNRNFTRYESISSLRGNILDRSGKLLATNRPVINIYFKGQGHLKLTEEQKNNLQLYEKITDQELSQDKMKEISRAEKLSKTIVLASDINFDLLSKISESFSENDSIVIETDFKRHYPHQSLACHVLGYLGHLEEDKYGGKIGLEKTYEELLKGKNGTNLKVINSFGKHLGQYEIEKTLSGQTITTTLDLDLQKIAENIFPENCSGALILMDPQDGSILSLISRPNFDPNIFLQPIAQDDWLKFNDKKPFLNRVCSASYPPGSIFKLIILSAALEKNLITQNNSIFCKGHTELVGRKYHCHRQIGHGLLSIKEAVANSCNILFFELAKRLDIDEIAYYANIFGLGQRTNSAFCENEGIVPSRKWKTENKGERWWLGETLSASIGQSFLLVTPLQIAKMICAIETGYLISPRIIFQSEPIKEPLKIKPEVRLFLKQSMRHAVTNGTAVRLNYIKDMTILAKTSTAQTSSLIKKKLGKEYFEHGWVSVIFSYKNEKPLVLIIMIENAGDATLSVMMAREFLKEYKLLKREN